MKAVITETAGRLLTYPVGMIAGRDFLLPGKSQYDIMYEDQGMASGQSSGPVIFSLAQNAERAFDTSKTPEKRLMIILLIFLPEELVE